MVDRSRSRTSRILTSLKKKGLIERWNKKPAVQNHQWHYVWYTRIIPEACVNTAKEADDLRSATVLPRVP